MIFQDSASSLNQKMKVADIIAEPMKIQHIYNLGYEQGIAKIDEVKEFLAK